MFVRIGYFAIILVNPRSSAASCTCPQSFSYIDKGIEAALIIVGTPISDARRVEWGLDDSAVCGELAQGVLVTEGQVAATQKTLQGGVMCRDYGADEKDFWYFSH